MDHEIFDNSVELGASEAESLSASGESVEVLNSLGNSLAEKTDLDGADIFAAHGHFEENLNFKLENRQN